MCMYACLFFLLHENGRFNLIPTSTPSSAIYTMAQMTNEDAWLSTVLRMHIYLSAFWIN